MAVETKEKEEDLLLALRGQARSFGPTNIPMNTSAVCARDGSKTPSGEFPFVKDLLPGFFGSPCLAFEH